MCVCLYVLVSFLHIHRNFFQKQKSSLTHLNLHTEMSKIHTKFHIYMWKSFIHHMHYLYPFSSMAQSSLPKTPGHQLPLHIKSSNILSTHNHILNISQRSFPLMRPNFIDLSSVLFLQRFQQNSINFPSNRNRENKTQFPNQKK